MLRKLIVLGWGMCLSLSLMAQETKIIGFDQVFNLNHDEVYELQLKNLNPGAQLWTAFYLVGVPKSASNNSQADFVVKGEGVINKVHPANPTERVNLVANHLLVRQNYSFHEFEDLVDEIEEQTGKKIQDPVLGTTDNVRVYGQIMDWIPEYNSSTPAKISFGITNPQDFEIKAAYVVIGEAEKTPQLLALDIHPLDTQQLEPSLQEQSHRQQFSIARFEAKFLIFLTLLGAAIFLNWGKWRRN